MVGWQLVLASLTYQSNNPPACAISGAMLACPLELGTTTYTIEGEPGKVTFLRLSNPVAGMAIQVDEVVGQSLAGVKGTFGEYCVYLNDFATEQRLPGFGEVGCYPKPAAESSFGALHWGSSTALAIAPNMTLWFQGYVQSSPQSLHSFTFTIKASPQSRGVLSFRQPRIDATIYCDGKPQVTAGSPWPNDSGRSWTVLGATIYALASPPQAACLYILDSLRKPRWSSCSLTPGNRRGVFMLPSPQMVHPGEFLFAQANFKCAPGGVWDWASYIYTY